MNKSQKIHFAGTASISFTLGWFIMGFWGDPPLETGEAVLVVVLLIVTLVLHILERRYVEGAW